jgi:KDO2-lipid IV(A) lauroyltransferase
MPLDGAARGPAPAASGRKRQLARAMRRARRRAAFLLGLQVVRWIGRMDLARAQRLGERLGGLAYRVRRTDRRRATAQVHAALGVGGDESRELVKRMFRHFGRIAAEGAVLRRLGPSGIDSLVEVHPSIAIVDEALRRGRGAILVTPHLGNFDVLAAWFLRNGYWGKVVGARVNFDAYNEFLAEARRNLGFETIFADESPREILKVLRKNGLIGMLPDQDTDKVEGVFVPFFGRPAYTPKGPVLLALAAGAALIPTFIPWEGGRYRLFVEPPVPLSRTGSRAQDILEGTIAWTRAFEAVIGRYPEQWPWLHRRWETTPERRERARQKKLRKRARSRFASGGSEAADGVTR